jgi:hypothetical protein
MGKSYLQDFETNKPEWTLEYILKKICIDRDESFLDTLIHDLKVYRMINQITNHYGFASKGGFLISKDVIKGIVTTELMWATWHDYDINRTDEDNVQNEKFEKCTAIENSYLTFVWKIVSLRVKTQINLERPCRLTVKKPKKNKFQKSIVDDYYDKKFDQEYGVWKDEENENDYRYKEIFMGGNYNSILLNNEIQNRWKSVYGHDFDEIKENETFDEILNDAGLTEKQIDVLTKIYKEGYTFKKIGEINGGVKKQSINHTKKNAIKKLRRKYKIT